jgi:hypothetical protein
MADVVRRLQAIEDMMRPLVPLRDQMAAIETTIAEQGQQQQLMNTGLLRIEHALHTQKNGRPPNGHRHDDEEDDGFPTSHKMELSKYDGVGDPMLWLNRCERYFRVRRTPENRCVGYASFYLTDNAQLWYHRMELNARPLPWPRFVQLVNKRFGPPLTDNPIGKITLLRRDDSVDDFIKRFMALSCRDTAITDDFIKCFIGKPLRIDVTLHQPPTLDDAIMLARAYEQRETVSVTPHVSKPHDYVNHMFMRL